jgi:LysR family transcriptional activator of nhaA
MNLNFGHLQYFHAVAESGGLTVAATALGVQASTVSAQVHALEEELGVQLFTRRGRSLVLSDAGRRLHRHTKRLFAVADELIASMGGEAERGARQRVVIGVSEDVAKLEAARILAPLFRDDEPRLYPVVREASDEQLAAELVAGLLDVVVSSETPAMTGDRRIRSVVLDTCRVVLVGRPSVAGTLRPGFPDSLARARLVLPGSGSPLRTELEAWLRARELWPDILAEIADGAMLKALVRTLDALIPVPESIVPEVFSIYGLEAVGVLDGTSVRYVASVVAGQQRERTLELLRDAAGRT